MSLDTIKRQTSVDSEKVCITDFEQKEYDSFSWENDDFGESTGGLFQMAFRHSLPFQLVEGMC